MVVAPTDTTKTLSGKTTVWILGDQLNPGINSLAGLDKSEGVVLMVELLAWARQRPYHYGAWQKELVAGKLLYWIES